MDKKKKFNIVIFVPVLIVLMIFGGLLTFLLVSGHGGAQAEPPAQAVPYGMDE